MDINGFDDISLDLIAAARQTLVIDDLYTALHRAPTVPTESRVHTPGEPFPILAIARDFGWPWRCHARYRQCLGVVPAGECRVNDGGPMEPAVGRDFFISYTAVNRLWAEWIAVQLEAAGYSTVLQSFDFAPGTDFVHEMHQATSNAARTIAVLSPAYFASAFSEAEWRTAFAKDPSGESELLVPVRVQPCDPTGLLKTRVYVDLVDADEPTCLKRLLDAVNKNRVRPTFAPFPGQARSARFPGVDPRGKQPADRGAVDQAVDPTSHITPKETRPMALEITDSSNARRMPSAPRPDLLEGLFRAYEGKDIMVYPRITKHGADRFRQDCPTDANEHLLALINQTLWVRAYVGFTDVAMYGCAYPAGVKVLRSTFRIPYTEFTQWKLKSSSNSFELKRGMRTRKIAVDPPAPTMMARLFETIVRP